MIITATKLNQTNVTSNSHRTVNLRCYSEPDALRAISPASLLALLADHRACLCAPDVPLPPPGAEAELDYEALARVFASPEKIPAELIERFHLVRQMSGKGAMDRMLDAVRQRNLDLALSRETTAADLAAQLLVRHPDLFQQLHAEQAVARYRAFTYFAARRKGAAFRPPEDLRPLENGLNEWFEAHQRGRSARVFWRQKGPECWFYIRHAEPTKREGCVGITDNRSGSMIYRKERHDLAVYDAAAAEIRLHVDCRHEIEVFRRVFGEHLFGDREFFVPWRQRYTLDPFRRLERASLACAGIEGLLAIAPTEVEFRRSGASQLWERLRAPDLLREFERRGEGLPKDAEIRQAKFAVQFTDGGRRMVTIRPPNYALFGRDDDAAVLEPWLLREGYIVAADGIGLGGDEP